MSSHFTFLGVPKAGPKDMKERAEDLNLTPTFPGSSNQGLEVMASASQSTALFTPETVPIELTQALQKQKGINPNSQPQIGELFCLFITLKLTTKYVNCPSF